MDIKTDIQKISLDDIERELYIVSLIEARSVYSLGTGSIKIFWEDLPSNLFGESELGKMIHLVQIAGRYKKEKVFTSVGPDQTINGYLSANYSTDLLSKMRIKLEDEKTQRINKGDTGFCSISNNVFHIKGNGDDKFSISFNVNKGKGKTLNILTILFDYWQKNAKYSDNWMITVVPKKYIFRRLKNLNYAESEINNNSLKTFISNLRQKIKDHGHNDIVKIIHDNRTDGYSIHIKKPSIV